MTCFTLRTKSPPDMTGARLRPRLPEPLRPLQHLAQVAASRPVVDERGEAGVDAAGDRQPEAAPPRPQSVARALDRLEAP